MKKVSALVGVFSLMLILNLTAAAQQIDGALGFGTVTAPSAQQAGATFTPQSIGGGTFINVSGDVLPWKGFGFGGEVAWRAKQNLYGGYQPFRPIFFDFGAVYAPQLGSKRVAGELQAGIGVQSARFYTPTFNCSFTGCTNYVSSNHIMGHFAAGLRLYATEHVFIRPEAHVYLVRNNFEFSGSRASRFGVSIGYTFKPAEE